MNLDKTNSLGEWAANFSGASQVLLKKNLDFCCGGQKSLEEACREKNLDSDDLMLEIKDLSEGAAHIKWNEMALEELIDGILENFHEKHRRDLEFLIPLSKKVESVHSGKEGCPTGLGDFLMKLQTELDTHMQKEEKILFPMIKSGQGPSASAPINVMMNEHVGHGESLGQLRKLTTNFELPSDACGSWQALYKGVATLEREVMEHVSIENNILFPKALNDSQKVKRPHGSDESGCCGSCS